MKVLIRTLPGRLLQLSPLTIIAIGLLYVLAVGAVDLVCPPRMTFTLFYLLGVAFVAWCSGKRAATFGISLASVAVMTISDWAANRAMLQPWVELWTGSTRLLVFVGTGWLIAEITRLTRNLGRLVEERTRQWKAEAERHKETSTRLAEALERFEQVINNITEVFWLTDVRKSQMVYVSPGYEHLWGRKREDLYREPGSWTEAVHPDDREEIIRRSLTDQARGAYEVEYRILRPDGSQRWIRDHAFPVRNAQGEVYRIAGLAEDITERKQTRALLQTQAAILESMAEGVVVTDEDGLIVQMNPAAERIWGYMRKEVIGQPASVFSALPEREAEAVMREVLAALKITGSWRGTFSNRRKDGAIISCEAVISRLEIQGRMLMVAVEQDVTERQQVQEHLEMQGCVLESMGEAVLVVDEHGTIVLTNPALDALLGYEPGELSGQPMLVMSGHSSDEYSQEFRRQLEQVRARGSVVGEYLARRKDGTLIEIATQISGATIGNRLCLVVVGQDVTERKRADQALRQSEETLRVFLDANPEPAFLADRDGIILAGNQVLARRLGVSKIELVGKCAFDLLPPRLAETRRAMFDGVIRSRQPVQYEDSCEGRHLLNFDSPVLDTAGNVTCVAVFALDITERKRGELTKEAFLLLGAKLSSAQNPLEVARAIYASVSLLWKWESGALDLWQPQSGQVETVLAWDVIDGQRREVSPGSPAGPPEAIASRLMGKGAELILRTPGDLPEKDLVPFGDIARRSASIMCVPVRAEGQAVGVLSIQSYSPNAFTQEDLRTLQVLADYCAGAVKRLRVEEAIKQREELNRVILSTAMDGYYTLDFAADPGGAIIDINDAFCRLSGYSREELLQMRMTDLEAEESPADVARHREKIMASRADRFETRHRRKDGQVIQVEISASLLTSNERRIFGFVRDITERKRAEAALREAHDTLELRVQQRTAELQAANTALRESEARLQLALDASNAGTWSWDAAINTSTWDDRNHKLFGFGPHDPRSKEAWLARVHPEDRERILARIQALEGPGAGDTWNEEYRALHPVKGERWMGSLGRIERDQAGRAVRLSGINLDITERKQVAEALREAHSKLEQRVRERTAELQATNRALSESEERYRALAEASPDAIFILDRDIKMQYANSTTAALWRRRPEELVGLTQTELFPPEVAQYHCKVVAEILETGEPVRREEPLTYPIGEQWIEVRLVPLFGEQGTVTSVMGVCRDFTERKRAERQLAEALDMNQKMIAASPMGIAAYKASGECVFANEALARIVGGTVGEVLQGNFRTLQSWQKSGLLHLAEKALSLGQAQRGEIYTSTRFGKSIWLDCQTTPFVSNGEPHLLTMILEITERKHAESLLRAQRDLGVGFSLTSDLETALKHFLAIAVRLGGLDCGGVYLIKEPGLELELAAHLGLSAAFAKAVAHYPADSLHVKLLRQGQVVFDTFANLPIPHSATELQEGLRAFALIPLYAQRKIVGALNLASHTSDEIPAQTRIAIEAIAAQAAGAIARIRAEEALRESERRLRAIVTSAPVVLFAVDQEGIIRFEDGQALKALGTTRASTVGRSVREVYAHVPAILENARRALRGEEFESIVEAGPIVLDCWYSPTRDKEGKPAGYIGVATNVTERHRLEQQILAISDREHARIGQDVHDGLCQHLVSLAFDANSLQRELATHRRPEAKLARRIADYLDQAITEARQLSRGLFPVRLATEGLPPALEELAKATHDRFGILCRFDSEGPAVIKDNAVATHLYRIAQEAVTNAAKHSQAQQVSIRLRAQAGQLELRVEDDGAGLSEAARSKSSGMGLQIMDYRARSIGGTLLVSAGRQGGTVVSCCISLASR